MSVIKAALVTYLNTKTGLTDLVGTRIEPIESATSSTGARVTFQRIAAEHAHHMRAAAGWCKTTIQIDCWAETAVACSNVAEQVRTALDGMRNTTMSGVTISHVVLQGERDTFEEPVDGSEKGVFRISQDWTLAHTESVPTFA